VENQNQYEEISLVELIVMWLRNWKPAVLLGSIVIMLGLAAVSSLDTKYDSKVKLEIGALSSDELIQLPESLVAQLEAKYRVGDTTQGVRPLPRLESVSHNKRSESPVIEFTARAETPEKAASYLNDVLSSLLQEHEKQYQSAKNEHQRLKDDLQLYLSELKVGKSKGGSKEINVADVLDSISKAARAVEIMKKTQMLSEPSVPVKPSVPKKTIFFAVVLLMGFAAMLFWPFVLAFVSTIREELQRQAEK
jgi:uncharacterized protein involved in exopolysaccharide biosynthesis